MSTPTDSKPDSKSPAPKLAVPRTRQQQAFPRDTAVRVLTRVLTDKQALDLALDGMNITDGEVRGWLQEVCSGTLRWKGRLDFILDTTAAKKKPSGWLRKILLIAAYQLIAQERTPAAWIVSETVDEVKRKEGEAPARFANASLRKIADYAEKWRNLSFSENATFDEKCAWASLPDWIWKRILKDHGSEWAQAYSLASLERPTLWIRAQDPDAKLDWAVAGPVQGSWQVDRGGQITEFPGFDEGKFIVQDISSQILIHEVVKKVIAHVGPGATALDLCAAPGGKSVGLAWNGLKVTATDIDPVRMTLLQETESRTQAGFAILAKDDLKELPLQDLVWVDSPCSGSGILRRHPDVRWLRQEQDLVGLMKTQLELFQEGLSHVKPGGFLVYSVCSVLKDEGPKMVAKAVAESKLKILESWTLAPHLDPHGDGFYACLIQA